jgi:hypothetical protein
MDAMNKTSIQKPNWTEWLAKKRASLAEGILLAHDVCPNKHVMAAGAGLGEEIDNSKWDLLQLSYNWLEDDETVWVKRRGPYPWNANEVEIDLPKYFKWLIEDVAWENLPAEILDRVSGKGKIKSGPVPTSPWLVVDSKDPKPLQAWYTAARYFARDLVKGDPSLLRNRNRLHKKIYEQLKQVGVNKRGGLVPPDPETIRKALTNIKFS